MRSPFLLFCLLPWPASGHGQPAKPIPRPLSPAQAQAAQIHAHQTQAHQAQAQAYIGRILASEMRAAEDPNHPMRYQLRKSTPRLTTTKKIIETRGGDVAYLISIDGKPLSLAAEQGERARLDGLLSDPSLQRHRQQSEGADNARALKALRALPTAFLYQYAGRGEGPAGEVEKFTFKPNPAFSPPDLELRVLTALTGEIWVDPVAERVVRLEGRLEHDVGFGWGILGQLNQGGSIVIEDANVYGDQWRVVRFELRMSGRVLFRSRNFDVVDEESHFEPLPTGLNYRQAIRMLRADP